MTTAKITRIISILGILLLLVLQYLWFRNSYMLMEHDIIQKSETNLRRAVEGELYLRFNKISNKFSVKYADKNKAEGAEVLAKGDVNQSNDINYILQDLLSTMGNKCSLKNIDDFFNDYMEENNGFSPKHSIRFIDSIQHKALKLKPSKYTLSAKITENQFIEIKLSSPLGSILRQAQFIFFVSLFLALLIGVILIIQLKSMLRENKFVAFIKEYTNALAHDLKTPISGIYMASSQLVSGIFEEKPDSRKHYYKMCQEQSSKLLATVDKILLIAKSEHTKIVPNVTVNLLKPYVEKIVDLRRQNNFRQKNVELTTSFQADDMEGQFDSFLIENTLNNLIDNAIKYSNTDVKIDVSCKRIANKLIISVKDNGFGIAKKEQKHIFDNFERGNKIEGKGIDGFGIGLNYVNRVIKAHNGNISVISDEGVGSEFVIELPQK